MNLNKKRLVQAIADQAGLSRKAATRATTAILQLMTASLSNGDDVKIAGFGRFYPQSLKARKGRHPVSGDYLQIPERRAVRFKCYKKLRETLNRSREPGATFAAEAMKEKRRRYESRLADLPQGKAVIRISGIPVCQFEIKDFSGNGSCILVEKNSVVLRNLHIGQEIELHMVYEEAPKKAVLQRSKIVHITQPTGESSYEGYVMVGMQTIDSFPIR